METQAGFKGQMSCKEKKRREENRHLRETTGDKRWIFARQNKKLHRIKTDPNKEGRRESKIQHPAKAIIFHMEH